MLTCWIHIYSAGSPSSDDDLFSGSLATSIKPESQPPSTAAAVPAASSALFGSLSDDDDDMFTTKASEPKAVVVEKKAGGLFGSPGESADVKPGTEASNKGEQTILKLVFWSPWSVF